MIIYNTTESGAEDPSKRNVTEELGIPLGEVVQAVRLGQNFSDKKCPLKV